jgi:hypothetical protein
MELISLKEIIENENFVHLLRFILQFKLDLSMAKLGLAVKGNQFRLNEKVVRNTYFRLCERFICIPYSVKAGEREIIDERIIEIIEKYKISLSKIKVL